MHNLDRQEMDRLDALLDRFDLARYRESVLAQASPCISMALIDPAVKPVSEQTSVPVGASKVGGDPDLPPGFQWPTQADGQAGFFLQIALGDLPVATWNHLPARGMLYLFCHDDTRAFWDPPGFELIWWDGDPSTLRRVERDVQAQNEMIGGGPFFGFSVARPLAFRAGTDFPPGSSSDRRFIEEFDDATRATDPEAGNRYLDFALFAADPGVEADQARGRGPFYHPIGRLLGYTDASIREDMAIVDMGKVDLCHDYDWRESQRDVLAREGASWRQFMRLESNPVTKYMSPCDASPIYLMARDDGARPWKPSGPIIGLASK